MNDSSSGLFTDLYELTMLESYLHEGLGERAAFELFIRELPGPRNYLLACGLDDALRHIERLSFAGEDLAYLHSLRFSPRLIDYLAEFHFTGDVRAVLEGTPAFAGEPLLEVVAPLPEAQLLETFLLNQIHFQTLAASKASRVVTAAAGRTVVDFGLRRMHGTDAGMKGARAFYIAGVAATSNVLAGRVYGIPVSGTMAHSYVQAHEDERAAFRAFSALHPGTVLLVDSYDTLEGVHEVVRLARELGEEFTVHAVRLDSGDLERLARAARAILDEAGLQRVEIFASGGLDEYAIADLVAAGAPIAGFGVGSRMGVSADAPVLDAAYKLVAYGGRGRMKLSPGKPTLPCRKQVFRVEERGEAVRDVIGLFDEALEGRPLLVPVMEDGRRLAAGRGTLEEARERAREELSRLPSRCRELQPAHPPYPVALSSALRVEADRARRRLPGAVQRMG